MPNKTLQVRVSDKSYHLFNELYENRRVKNSNFTKKDLMDDVIKKTYMQENGFKDVDDENNDKIMKLLEEQLFLTKKIYEYVTLLVKGNNDLPMFEGRMKEYVERNSRFDKFINAKLNDQKNNS